MAVIKMIDFVYMEGEQMNTKINQLLEYALKNGMIEKYDYDYSANLLIDLFGIQEFKIEEVFMNFFSNAVNHCEGEKIIDVKMEQKDGRVRVSVFNTGKPIPEDSIGHIWEKFYKVDKARTREYGGSGVGLSIVKAIMDSMNQPYGVINYTNGVEFWIEIETK